MSAYLMVFWATVCLAAAPAAKDVRSKWEAASVSGMVKSQVRHRPLEQVTSINSIPHLQCSVRSYSYGRDA